MENIEVFNGVVENACDFTERSVRQFRESPKNSLINFYTGLELFLKARLISEHWSLIFSRPEYADKAKFEAGDFGSANFDSLVTRLEKIANEKLTSEAKKIFNKLRQHRNKLVHFHHNAFTSGDTEQILIILRDQGQAWWHLYRLLTEDWSDLFRAWLDKIGGLNWLMHRDPEFLNAKWELIEPLVSEKQANGVEFIACNECGKPAAEISQDESESRVTVTFANCLVCYHREIGIECIDPDCTGMIWHSDGSGSCTECEQTFGLSEIVDLLATPYDKHDGEEFRAWCGLCEPSVQSVVRFGEYWICLSCLESFEYDEIGYCDWCGDINVGVDLSASYFSGCVICDGKDPDKL